MPSISGMDGMFRDPTALTTNRASMVSVAPSRDCTVTVQRPEPSSHRASVTSVPKRTWRRTS